MTTRARLPRWCAVVVVVALGTAALSGCSREPAVVPTPLDLSTGSAADGPDDLAGLDATEVVRRAAAAASTAGPVRMTGTYTAPLPVDDDGRPVTEPGAEPQTLSLDVHGTPDRFTASFETGSLRAEMVRDGEAVYVRGDERLGVALGEPRVADGWVRFDAAAPVLEPWLALADVPALVASFVEPRPEVTFSRAGATSGATASGTQLEVTSRGRLVGTVTVANGEPAVPLALAVSDPTGSGELTFAAWGEPFRPDVPTDTVIHRSR